MGNNTTQLITATLVSFIVGYFAKSFISTKQAHIKRAKRVKKVEEVSNDDSDSDESDDYSDQDESEVEIDSSTLNDIPGEARMVLVVRTDLKMGKGKAAAQCCHAALGCYRLMSDPESEAYNMGMLKRWFRNGQAKITLQCPSKDDLDLLYAQAMSLNVNSCVIHDAGRTQIAAGSATVLGLGPAPKTVLDQITGELKLY